MKNQGDEDKELAVESTSSPRPALEDWQERSLQRQRERISIYEVKEWAKGAHKVCIARNVEAALYEAQMLLERGDFGVTIHKGTIHPDALAKLEPCQH